MALTLSGTNGVVGAGFTVDASGVSVTAGVGTFSSIGAGASVPAAGLTGSLPTISAASLTSVPAANIVGVATAGFERSGGFPNTWVKLQTTTVSSNVDNVTFTNSITGAFSTYKMYAIVFNEFKSTADDYNLYIRVQGSSGTDTTSYYRWRVNSTDGDTNAQDSQFFRCNKDAIGNATTSDNNEDVSGILYFSGFPSGKRLRYRSEIIFGNASADNNSDLAGGGMNHLNETTGILFYPQNGQWSTGTATLYGIAQ